MTDVSPGLLVSQMMSDDVSPSIYESADESLSYGQLSMITFEIVLQTVIICLIGFISARNGYLPKSAQKSISNLNAMVFTPCLIFSKMASSLSLSALDDLALIPVLFVLTTGVSYACGRGLSRAFHFTKAESNFVTAMAVFGNSNSLPVSLTVSLASTLPTLRWPDIPGDSADNVTSRGLLYLLIFQQLGQVVRWSWGYNTLLAKPGEQGDPESQEDYIRDANECQDGPSSSQASTIFQRTDSIFYTVVREINAFMNPPLWSMLLALIVASIPPLKRELFENGGFLQKTLGMAVQQTGRVAIPLILVVLGSNLAPDEDAVTASSSPNQNRIVFASLMSRMVLPSFVLLPIIALSVKYLQISILDDPIFLVASFILTISPPAIQLSQICQLNGVFEGEMASVLFWGYVVLTLPSTIFIVVAALEVLRWSGITN